MSSKSKKLMRKIRERERTTSEASSSSSSGRRNDEYSLAADLFGLDLNGSESGNEEIGVKARSKRAKIRKLNQMPEDEQKLIWSKVFNFLTKQGDLMNLRHTNALVSEVATNRFSQIHSFIEIETEEKAHHFDETVKNSKRFPFSRFTVKLEQIPKLRLVRFFKTYEENIFNLQLDPYLNPRATTSTGNEFSDTQIMCKLNLILQNAKKTVELNIKLPPDPDPFFSPDYGYGDVNHTIPLALRQLRNLGLSFVSTGFSEVTADFVKKIIRSTSSLKKLRIRVPDPKKCPASESDELSKVLQVSSDVPYVSIYLTLASNNDLMCRTLAYVVTRKKILNIKQMTLYIGRYRSKTGAIGDLLEAHAETLNALKIFRNKQPLAENNNEIGVYQILRIPTMMALRKLTLDTTNLWIEPIQADQFPVLKSLSIHLNYGNDPFFIQSVFSQDSIEELTLYCKQVSIVRIKETPTYFNLPNLKTLHLVNPPAEYISFFCTRDSDSKIESLTVAQIGGDPTYPTQDVLQHLNGLKIQFVGIDSFLDLNRLYLFMKIDEETGSLIGTVLSGLRELVVDDSGLCENTIKTMRKEHDIYISWRRGTPQGNELLKIILKNSGILQEELEKQN